MLRKDVRARHFNDSCIALQSSQKLSVSNVHFVEEEGETWGLSELPKITLGISRARMKPRISDQALHVATS